MSLGQRSPEYAQRRVLSHRKAHLSGQKRGVEGERGGGGGAEPANNDVLNDHVREKGRSKVWYDTNKTNNTGLFSLYLRTRKDITQNTATLSIKNPLTFKKNERLFGIIFHPLSPFSGNASKYFHMIFATFP